MGIAAVVVSQVLDESLRDPDGFMGPAYLRMPGMVLAAFALDVIPRALWRSRGRLNRFGAEARAVIDRHWTKQRIAVVAIGLVSFYVTYVSYRNLKHALLVYRGDMQDAMLHAWDKWMMFGNDPAILMHDLLGTSVWAQILSFVYMAFLPISPLSVAAWLVWARYPQAIWYVTANCLCWTLGTISYYIIPALGPAFEYPQLYQRLDHTAVTDLQDALWNGRYNVYFNPDAQGVQTVAAFASLHCAIILCMALMAHYTVPSRAFRIACWVFFVLTVMSTIYFGWHYIADDIAGIAIAIIAVYAAGRATGHRFVRGGREAIHVSSENAKELVPAER